MTTLSRLSAVLACLVWAAAPLSAAAPLKKVLFFSKSSGFEHSVIKRNAGNPSFAEQVLKEFGAKHGLKFTCSKDGSLFSAAYLAQFDGFLFYTTGDLTQSGTDRQPPMSAEGKAAFLAAVAGGKGFVGLHSASDTFHSPTAPGTWQNDGDRTDPYIRLLGAEFIKHDAQQPARQRIADAKFPGLSAVPADFGPLEEWYSLKNFNPDLHVLLVQETAGMQGPSYQRPPYPSTWARAHGKGRVFYTSMGHREDVWMNPVFQAVLLGGLDWTLGRAEADVTPNLTQVTPGATTLPVYVAPPAKAPKAPKKN